MHVFLIFCLFSCRGVENVWFSILASRVEEGGRIVFFTIYLPYACILFQRSLCTQWMQGRSATVRCWPESCAGWYKWKQNRPRVNCIEFVELVFDVACFTVYGVYVIEILISQKYPASNSPFLIHFIRHRASAGQRDWIRANAFLMPSLKLL